MKQSESDDFNILLISYRVSYQSQFERLFTSFDDNVVEIGSVVGNPLTLSIKTKLFQASFCSVCTSFFFIWTSFSECEKLPCSYFASENSSSLLKRSYHIVPCTEFLSKRLQFAH